MLTIDQDKIESYKELDQKEGKIALADYAQNEFGVKLVRNKTFENMLADLQTALDEKRAALPTDEQLAAEPQIDFTPMAAPPGVTLDALEESLTPVEPLVLETPPGSAKQEHVASERDPDMDGLAGFKPAPETIPATGADFVDPKANNIDTESLPPAAEPVNSEASNTPPGDVSWLDSFSPTISLMGRSERSNGYYTLSYWIYDWIKQNPSTWYTNPEGCPHESAIPVIKSLAWYIKRDGQVTIRETRNSRFVDLTF